MTNRKSLEQKIASGECMFPDCGRPSVVDPDEKFPICAGHLAYTDAQAELDEIGMAENVLSPWVETCEAIAFDHLTRVMRNALEELRDEKSVWQGRMDQAGKEIDEG